MTPGPVLPWRRGGQASYRLTPDGRVAGEVRWHPARPPVWLARVPGLGEEDAPLGFLAEAFSNEQRAHAEAWVDERLVDQGFDLPPVLTAFPHQW